MKKVLSVLLIAAVIILAFMGALAVIPHVHGSDTDHSSHKICPVYQVSLYSLDMTVFAAVSLFLIFLIQFFKAKKNLFGYYFFYTTLSSRAPPFSF